MYLVKPNQLADVWPLVHAWIERAMDCSTGDENSLDVLIAIAREQYFLFHEPDKFAAVAQIQNHPRHKICFVAYVGGTDLRLIKESFHNVLFPWAKKLGCYAVRCCGRSGWRRVMDMYDVGTALQLNL